jgi:hypothetical protein
MAKSVMPKQTSGLSDSSEWDGLWNVEPERPGHIGAGRGAEQDHALLGSELRCRLCHGLT